MPDPKTEQVRLTEAEKSLGEDVRDWGWMRGFTIEAVEQIVAERVAQAKAEVAQEILREIREEYVDESVPAVKAGLSIAFDAAQVVARSFRGGGEME